MCVCECQCLWISEVSDLLGGATDTGSYGLPNARVINAEPSLQLLNIFCKFCLEKPDK